MPVEYSVISIVRWKRLLAESIRRATSSGLRISGIRRLRFGIGRSSSRKCRFNVFT
jgi:hypothetical protein